MRHITGGGGGRGDGTGEPSKVFYEEDIFDRKGNPFTQPSYMIWCLFNQLANFWID